MDSYRSLLHKEILGCHPKLVRRLPRFRLLRSDMWAQMWYIHTGRLLHSCTDHHDHTCNIPCRPLDMPPVDYNNHHDLHMYRMEDTNHRHIKVRYPDNPYTVDTLRWDMDILLHMDLKHSWGNLTPLRLIRPQLLLGMDMVEEEDYKVDRIHLHIVADKVYTEDSDILVGH